jgi:hypothetical protein
VSPILVRPVREQLEHDRIIRLLQARFRRRFDVGINPGAEQNSPVGSGATAVYPDVVLASPDRGRKIQAVIEVETVESVNNLEALAEWVPFGRLRSAFHLYVPAAMVDVAKRLCTGANIPVAEIHTYHWVGDEMRFIPVYKAPGDGRTASVKAPAGSASAKASAGSASAKASAGQAGAPKKKAAKPTRPAARKPAAKSSRKAGRSPKRK